MKTTRFKASLEEILVRAQGTLVTIGILAAEWTAPYFPSPAEFHIFADEAQAQKAALQTQRAWRGASWWRARTASIN